MRRTLTLIGLLGLYLILLAAINIVHFRLFTVQVVFYAALADAALAALAVGLGLLALRRLPGAGPAGLASRARELSRTETGLAFLCLLLIGYIAAITVPTVIDRSLSIYILEKLDQRGGAIALPAMKDIFVQEYIPEYRLMDVRMTEQLGSGTIRIEDDCVRLTPRGRLIVTLTRAYRRHLLPSRRLLLDDITDALTDPFKDRAPVVDFRCRPVAPSSAAAGAPEDG